MDTDSDIVDSDSTIVDTHSNQREKVSTIASESLSTINRNDCPRSIGMGVHDGSEYAVDRVTDRAHIIDTGKESYRFRRTMESRKRKTKSAGKDEDHE